MIPFVVLVMLLFILYFRPTSFHGSKNHPYGYGFRLNYEVFFPDVYVKVALLEGKHILKVKNTIFGSYFRTQ